MLLALALLLQNPARPAIDLAGLLAELVDRSALARLPAPPYVARQASSYDRASVSPDKDWFANGDAGQYVRTEEREGRTEGVLLDVDGLGAIVRIWSANPAGTLRITLDGADAPVLAEDMASLLGGTGKVAAPLSQQTSHGWNLYLPIPYAKHCLVTCDQPKDVYYHVGYRTYPAGTAVTSFAAGDIERASGAIEAARRAWLHPAEGGDADGAATCAYTLPRGWDAKPPAGPRAVTAITFRVQADDLELALRRATVRMTCDGEETVACPLGDFFASSPGLNAYESWPITVARGADGAAELACRWVMPYARTFDLAVDPRDVRNLRVTGVVRTRPWTFDDRSLLFHARWRASGRVSTRPKRDWTHLAVTGRGVFVGDMLSIGNPVKAWWGEGDEKFYVDGETFPSHFGTGTEDYYGYAWCGTELFQAPLHDQTRCDGPGNFGWCSVNRFRALDAIPFEKSLRFDMELWHWRECTVEMAATTFYYARPGAKDDTPAIRDADLSVAKLEWKPFRIDGAVEAEDAQVVAASPGIAHEPQALDDEQWSGGRQLWVRAKAVGDFVELAVPVASAGRHEIVVYPTKSFDYGTVQFSVDGARAGDPIVTFNTEEHAVGAPRAISLGTFDVGREFKLRAELVGTSDRSDAPHTYFGIDCVVVR